MKSWRLAVFLIFCTQLLTAQPATDFRKKNAPVPPFAIKDLSGRIFTNAALKRNKPILLTIFSPQCEHCALALDELRAMAPLLQGKQIILVTEARNKEFLREFLRKRGYDKEPLFKNIGWDVSNLIYFIYNYGPLPQFNLYDRNGRLAASFTGKSPMDSVRNAIRQLAD